MKTAVRLGLSAILMFPSAAGAVSPTVVELYQSQGCSSCPPAIKNVNAIADRTDILALTFAVTYWDHLGWKDTFAKSAFTSRQYDYAHGLHHDGVYTPQVVIDGRADLVGADRSELLAAIAHAAPSQGPEISVSGNSISISVSQKAATADVWLVRYDPRIINVEIGAGENSGISIAHRNVVRDIVRLGGWIGTAQTYSVPSGGDPAWRAAILVQDKYGGPILSAKRI